jgi:hypothetical protein
MGFRPAPSPTDFLNNHALIRSGQGPQGPTQNRPYAGNPNAYFNRIRDNGFVSHSDIARRQSSVYRRPPRRATSTQANARPQNEGGTAQAAASETATPTARARKIVPLASFFNAMRQLVWPQESPVDGELGDKRDASDAACLAVLDEQERQQAASLATVAEARQKLLDYGRPALQQVRQNSTATITEMFNGFLLSLYDSLADAARTP